MSAFRSDALLKSETDTNHSGSALIFQGSDGGKEEEAGGESESEKNDEGCRRTMNETLSPLILM